MRCKRIGIAQPRCTARWHVDCEWRSHSAQHGYRSKQGGTMERNWIARSTVLVLALGGVLIAGSVGAVPTPKEQVDRRVAARIVQKQAQAVERHPSAQRVDEIE